MNPCSSTKGNRKFLLLICGINVLCARVPDTQIPWLEPRVFPEVTIWCCVFAVYTNTNVFVGSHQFCSGPIWVLLLNQRWGSRRVIIKGSTVLIRLLSGATEKADISLGGGVREQIAASTTGPCTLEFTREGRMGKDTAGVVIGAKTCVSFGLFCWFVCGQRSLCLYQYHSG